MDRARAVGVLFVAIGILEVSLFLHAGFRQHAYSVATPQRRSLSFEGFNCIELKRQYKTLDRPLSGPGGECRLPVSAKLLMLMNLPVFIVTIPITMLAAKLKVSEVIVFYAANAVAIPLFWYGIGVAWAKRIRTQKS